MSRRLRHTVGRLVRLEKQLQVAQGLGMVIVEFDILFALVSIAKRVLMQSGQAQCRLVQRSRLDQQPQQPAAPALVEILRQELELQREDVVEVVHQQFGVAVFKHVARPQGGRHRRVLCLGSRGDPR